MPIKNVFGMVEEVKKDLENLSLEDLDRELSDRDDLLLLDIREIQEYVDLGTIPSAINTPRGMLEFWADPASPYYRDYFQENKRVVLFCAGGGRSAFAAKALKEMGYADVAHLEAGFSGWAESGRKVENTTDKVRWMRKPRD